MESHWLRQMASRSGVAKSCFIGRLRTDNRSRQPPGQVEVLDRCMEADSCRGEVETRGIELHTGW
jgi:hypothetical protein